MPYISTSFDAAKAHVQVAVLAKENDKVNTRLREAIVIIK